MAGYNDLERYPPMGTDSVSHAILPLSEQLLATRLRNGDPRAEEELIRTYRRAAVLIATVRTRDPDIAADLAQDILIAVLKALRAGQIRDGERLPAFIQGRSRNIINNYFRSRSRHPVVNIDEVEIPGSDPLEQQESAEREKLVQEELAKCSAIDQTILLLSLVDGHSLNE